MWSLSSNVPRRGIASAEALAPVRPVLRPVLALVCAGLVVLAASQSGGYFPDDYLLTGSLALVACVVGLWVVGPTWRPTRGATVTVGALAGLAAWAGVSSAWSPDPAQAALEMGRTLGYAAAFLLAMLTIGDGRHARLLLRLLIAALVGIAALALLGRLRPDLFGGDSLVVSSSAGRLGSIITYWNGLGAIAAMAILGAVGLAGDAREHAAVRVAAAAGGVLTTCALYLTLSRGSALSLVVALVVVLVLSPRRARLGVSALLIIGGGLAGILLLRRHPELVDGPITPAAQRSTGGAVLSQMLIVAVVTGAAQYAAVRFWPTRRASDETGYKRSAPPILAALPVVAVTLALVGTYALVGDRAERQANSGTGSLRSFVDRQYFAFMNPIGAPGNGEGRLASVQSSRSDAYRVALRGLRQHPLEGDGAGSFHVRWYRERRSQENLRNAHSLELETLSELGLVGGGLLLAVLASLLTGLRSLRERRGTVTRSQAAAAGGILVVWVVHSALDWDWQLSAVTLPALIAGALCLAPRRLPLADGERSGVPAR